MIHQHIKLCTNVRMYKRVSSVLHPTYNPHFRTLVHLYIKKHAETCKNRAKTVEIWSKIGKKIFLIKGVGGLILLYYIYNKFIYYIYNIISLSYIRAREEAKSGYFLAKIGQKTTNSHIKLCTNVRMYKIVE